MMTVVWIFLAMIGVIVIGVGSLILLTIGGKGFIDLLRRIVLLRIRPIIIGPQDMAIINIFGAPVEFLDSGFHWIPWARFLQCGIIKFPRTMFNLDYRGRKVVTLAAEGYGRQQLTVDSVAYVNLPQCYAWVWWEDEDGNQGVESVRSLQALAELGRRLTRESKTVKSHGGLVEILRRKVPTDEPGLTKFTDEAVASALRVALGQVTWVTATSDIEIVRAKAEEVFRSSDGALITSGFHPDDLRLAIEEIPLPPELAKALPQVDVARLEADAAKYVAEQRATETVGSVIRSMAESQGKEPSEIRALIDRDAGLQKEFRKLAQDLTRRRMAIDGQSFVDIRVEGAGGVKKTVLELIAAWQRMPQGGKDKGKAEETRGGRKVRVPGGERIMSEEERRRVGIP